MTIIMMMKMMKMMLTMIDDAEVMKFKILFALKHE